MNTTLEVLRDARARLADETEPFDFPEWSYCTCGHIYRAATGSYGNARAVWPTGGMSCAPLYVRVICNAAAALGWDGRKHCSEPRWAFAEANAIAYVSTLTERCSGAATAEGVTRDAAIEVLDEAIAHIEAAERKAMHTIAIADPDAGLDGPSRTIIVEPVEAPRPTRTPAPEPDREDTPVPTDAPVEEPVPA
jgi:hypothetical protein